MSGAAGGSNSAKSKDSQGESRKKGKKENKKLTIWEKYELHKKHAQEMRVMQEKIEAEAEAEVPTDREEAEGIEEGRERGEGHNENAQGESGDGSGGGGAKVASWEYGKQAASEHKAKKVGSLLKNAAVTHALLRSDL